MSLLEKHFVEPVGDVVVLKRRAVEEKVGALFVPDSVKQDSQLADVLAVGPGRYNDGGTRNEPQVKVGDVVMIDRICGLPVEVEGEKLVFCREPEILAIIKKK